MAAATPRRTGMEPTIRDAWLTVVWARPWNWMRNWMGIPNAEETRMMRISLHVKRTRFRRATGSRPTQAKRKR